MDNTAIVDEGLTFQLSLRRLSDAVNALPDVEAKAALHGLPESVWKSATQATMKGQNGLAMLLDAAGIERAA